MEKKSLEKKSLEKINFKFRAMCEADIPQVVAIDQAVQLQPWGEQSFTSSLYSDALCVVADSCETTGGKSKIVGYAILAYAVAEAELHNIAVDPQMQRQGIGAALLDYVINSCSSLENAKEKVCKIFLEVRASNSAAIALYIKAGFVQVGERRAYYPTLRGRESALLFQYNISQYNLNQSI